MAAEQGLGAVAAAAAPAVVGNASKSSPLSVGSNAFFGLNLKNRNGFLNGGRGLRAVTSRRDARRSSNVGPLRVVAEKVVGIDLGITNSASRDFLRCSGSSSMMLRSF